MLLLVLPLLVLLLVLPHSGVYTQAKISARPLKEMLVASVGLGISLLKVEVLWLVGVQNCRAGCWASVITHGDGASMHGIAELYDPGVLSEELFKLIEAMRFGLLSQSPLHTAWGLKPKISNPSKSSWMLDALTLTMRKWMPISVMGNGHGKTKQVSPQPARTHRSSNGWPSRS